jgi:hypothetical protein
MKLLMEYDTKLTSTENTKIILETIPNWFKNLAINSRNVVDDVFNNLGGVIRTEGGQIIDNVDDLLNVAVKGKNALDDVSKELFRNSVLKNTTITLAEKNSFINALVKNPVTTTKYANKTNQQIFSKFKNAGYPDDVAQKIANKLKPTKTTPKPNTGGKTNTGSKTNTPNQSQIDKANAAKLAKQRAENAKLLSKQLNGEVNELERIVVDFENKTAKEVLKNPGLKQKVREAKNFLDDIKTKDLSVLSKYKQTQLNALEATIKNANPSVYSEITNFIGKGWTGFRKLHWGIQAIGVVLLVKFFGGKETGQILKNIWNGAKSLGGDLLRGMGILDDPGTTDETTPDDDLELFKQFTSVIH